MFQMTLANVRKACPLVHNITNYVTVNDHANTLLARGTSPIMVDDGEEVEEITVLCAGLNINTGTLNRRTMASMLLAGRRTNVLGYPAVLDPVDTGALKLRTETAERLLKEARFTVTRGSISRIKTLAYGNGTTSGVDADIVDKMTDENLPEMVAFAKAFVAKTGAVIAITGTVGIVADSSRAYCIRNGHPMMAPITGAGCQLSAITAALVAASREQALEATAAVVVTMGHAGELAYERRSATGGNATYWNGIIDAIYNMTSETLEKGARCEVY